MAQYVFRGLILAAVELMNLTPLYLPRLRTLWIYSKKPR